VSAARLPTFGILFVCTGNICRSPLAERLGRTHIDAALGEEASRIGLSSAGTHPDVGSPMHPLSATVLRDLGGDPEGFRARRLSEEDVRNADLVLTMTREHRSAVLALAPRAMARTFTLLEAADLARITAASDRSAGSAAPDRVTELAAARPRRTGGRHDDVHDPIGGSLEVHRTIGGVIAEALGTVLSRIVVPHAALRL
jgi:protein-tyrosine-phosphatase